MSTRHERRKSAKLRSERKLLGLAQAARAAQVAAIVRDNKSRPIERNYYAGIQSCVTMCANSGARKGGGFAAQSRQGRIVQGKFVPAGRAPRFS